MLERTKGEYSIRLHNALRGTVLDISMRMPELEIVTDVMGNRVGRWHCSYDVKFDDDKQAKTVYCETWIGALAIALDGLRRLIPDDEENDWETEDGLPSWLVFPKIIPVGWGHAEQRRLWKAVQARETEINQRMVEKRRDK